MSSRGLVSNLKRAEASNRHAFKSLYGSVVPHPRHRQPWPRRAFATAAPPPRHAPPSPSSASSSPAAYHEAYWQSISDPATFWSRAAEDISWYSSEGPTLRYSEPPSSPSYSASYRWFPERRVNVSYNCLDLHVQQGRAQQAAIIYDSPVTGMTRSISYADLLTQVSTLAGALQQAGVKQGDVVLLYMPMLPEAVVAMLACARIGAPHCVVFGGFAAAELAKRIVDCRPVLIITASCGVEGKKLLHYKPIVDDAITRSGHAVSRVVVLQRPQVTAALSAPRDVTYDEFYRSGSPVPPVPVHSSHPLYILYTSGTTGAPKGVVRDSGGHAVSLKWSLRHLFAVRPGSVFWASSDIGWVVGHSYIVYAPLLLGCTSVLYEGKPVGTPDAQQFWRVLAQHGVEAKFTAPTALRAIKKEDPEGKGLERWREGMRGFQALYVAGERADPDTVDWASKLLGVPVIDNYWQTESGWPIICNPRGQHLFPIRQGSAAFPVCGFELHILDDDGRRITAPDTDGNLAIRLPLPPGCLLSLHNNHQRFLDSYLQRFPSYYDTSDTARIDDSGYVSVMGRSDDVMNVAAHRLSSAQMEEAVAAHPLVAECAVVSRRDAVKGEVPVALVVLKMAAAATGDGQQTAEDREEKLGRECIARVRESVGAVAGMQDVVLVPRLPKTRSGKILRKVLRQLLDGEEVSAVATIEDAAAIDEVKEAIQRVRQKQQGKANTAAAAA